MRVQKKEEIVGREKQRVKLCSFLSSFWCGIISFSLPQEFLLNTVLHRGLCFIKKSAVIPLLRILLSLAIGPYPNGLSSEKISVEV